MSSQEMFKGVTIGEKEWQVAVGETQRFKVFNLNNFRDIPQINSLTQSQLLDIEIVGSVLPFRTNNYVVDELIDWDNAPDDPIFTLNFPRKGMLKSHHYNKVATALISGAGPKRIEKLTTSIRYELDPHPAGQMKDNRPDLDGEVLKGMQHKYPETVLFFPAQGQTCHAYCTFCFRWAQFVGIDGLKIAMKEAELLVRYLEQHPEVTDVLFTGGDPMVMKARVWETYINALLDADLPNLKNIRIGTKALSYWPYRFLTDSDSDQLLTLLEKVNSSGKRIALMAHFNHYRELEPRAAQAAIAAVQQTGTVIRSQSPVLNHINAEPQVWAEMWKAQVRLGIVPYYMFIPRDTGAQHYFSVSLEKAWDIYRKAYSQVGGLSRSVRGPVMSCHPGKVQVLGVAEVNGEKVYTLRAIQARQPNLVHQPFFAKYDPEAVWYTDLEPAFSDRFIFD